MHKIRLFVGILALLLLFAGNVQAEEIHQNFSHKLGFGNSSKSFEHKIDLPQNLSTNGKFFVSRSLKLDGKLVIEREELTKTYYYIKVRLPKMSLWYAKGSIDIILRAENTGANAVIPTSPMGLKVYGSDYARFAWNGDKNYSAITLFDITENKTVWERVILNSQKCVMDEGYLRVGHHYSWSVKQAGISARYSEESKGYFKVVQTKERCRKCFGSGYVTCTRCNGSGQIVVNGPNNTPVAKVCNNCHGTGRERCMDCMGHGYNWVPKIIPETKNQNLLPSNSEDRSLLYGFIKSIDLKTDDLGNTYQGKITVTDKNGIDMRFKVSKYTFIMVVDNGYGYAGSLKQLKPGWKCRVGYDIPPDDSWDNMDLYEELKLAENMTVYYPGESN